MKKKITPGFILKLYPYNTRLFSFAFSAVLTCFAFLGSTTVSAQLPDEFQKVELVTGFTNAVNFEFAPDGRIFIVDRFGELFIYKPDTQTTVSAGTLQVFSGFEDGLLGIAIDPDFTNNDFVYLHYSPESITVNRVSRFTMNGDQLNMASEVIMMQWPTQRTSCCHSGGDLAFDSAGNLYIATGDNTDHSDFAALDENNSDLSSEKSSSNTNDLRGKILRITPQPDGTYTIPGGNLFPGGTGGRAEIYVMGARNPYRMFIDKDNTDWLFWGEVGPDANAPTAAGPEGKDEINLTKNAGNYGWPYFSGNNEAYQITYENPPRYNDPASPVNTSTWNTGATNLPPAQPSWLDFFHKCFLAGPRYYFDPSIADQQKLPIEFDNYFFYFDFNSSRIWAVEMDVDGNILSNEQLAPSVFPAANLGFIDMKIGPDGHMYILEYGEGFRNDVTGTGKLVRIDYTGIVTNSSPVVEINATPNSGSLPLDVSFSSEGTFDPNGDPLTYAWDFETDGTIDSTLENPSFTYTVAGNYNVQLRVDDGNGGTSTKNITVYAGNNAATFTFNTPIDGGFMNWGDDIDMDLVVTDVEDGTTADGSINCADVNVVPSMGHLNHFHDDLGLNGCPATLNIDPTNHNIYGEMDIFYVLGANYTDTGGLMSFDQVLLHPKRKEAEFYDVKNSISEIGNSDPWGGGSAAIRANHDGYIVFEGRNLANMTAVKYRVAALAGGGSIELRLNSPTGTLLSTTAVPATGSLNTWTDVQTNITDPGGKNDLYFVFKRNAGEVDIFDLNYVEFIGAGVSVDNTPPVVNNVSSTVSDQVWVEFSEALNEVSAETISNYSITSGITISAAELQPDNRTVILTTATLSSGVSYTLSVNNVQNQSGLAVAAGTYSFMYQVECNVTPFPNSWTIHELLPAELPHRSVYILPFDDLDGDGLKDIVTGAWWFKNPGTAGGNWVQNTIGNTFNNVAYVHDFDGDGDMDLLGTTGAYTGSDLVWAQNDGSGNFTVYNNIPSGSTTYTEPFLAGIAGGIYLPGGPYQLAINWNGAETGTSQVQMLTVPADPVNTQWTLENIHPDSLGEDLNNGDIDGDGDLDLYQVGNWLRNEGNGTWTAFSTGITYNTTFDRSQLVDFDRDGDLDGVAGQLGSNEEFAWFEAPADPTQPWIKHILDTNIDGSLSVEAVDIDFDGDMDIVVGEWQGANMLFVFENDLCNSGTFIKQTIDSGGTGFDHHDGALATDIDDDGDLDIISIGWDNIVPRIFENTTGTAPGNQAPVVNNPGLQLYSEGADVSLQVVANDPNIADILTYSAQGLPANLTINQNSGQISGTLSVTPGDYTVTVRATDQGGLFDEETFTMTVGDFQSLLRINSGGPAFTYNTEDWMADQYFTGGALYDTSAPINATMNDELFQTERNANSGTLIYELPVPEAGVYGVRLYFAEIFHNNAGLRLFDVDIESGQGTLTNYDIFASSGGKNTARTETFTANVTDGNLTIVFTSVLDRAKISGIELLGSGNNVAPVVTNPGTQLFNQNSQVSLQISATDPNLGDSLTFSAQNLPADLIIDPDTGVISGTLNVALGNYDVIVRATDLEGLFDEETFTLTVGDYSSILRINAGGPSFTFSAENWISDTYFTGGSTFDTTSPIAGSENDVLYQTERNLDTGTITYEIPVSEAGSYGLRLHFAEIFHTTAGARSFNVDIEGGQGVLTNYDIFAASGGPNTAKVENFTVDVTDGALTIVLTNNVDRASISGIEVLGNTNFAPIITNPGQVNYNEGDPVNLQIEAIDPNGDLLTYAAQGLPEGLNIDSSSGIISGNLTALEGNYEISLNVSDPAGAFDEEVFTITVGNPVNSLFINSGGASYTFNGIQWSTDQHFVGGGTFGNIVEIANTDNDQLYQSERFNTSGTLVYQIPVENGLHNLSLHFAEIYYGLPGAGESGGVGSRIFNIDIENGQQQIANYDIVEAAGGSATAVVELFNNVSVSDGNLTITLTSVVENPKISGIAVVGSRVPVVNAGADQNITLPENSVQLIGSANDPDGGTIASYLWTQQSGPAVATLQGEATTNLTASDLVEGTYVFRLTATDDEGDIGFDELTVIVVAEGGNEPPIAAASASPLNGLAPLPVNFTGSNSTDDLGIESYLWDFGTGDTSIEADPTYTFNAAGEYTVTLTVTDAGGLEDVETLIITVTEQGNQAPTAVASATPNSGLPPLEVQFTGDDSSDDNGIVSYLWDFKDGTTSDLANPVHTFQNEGGYSVTLTVTDAEGLTDTATVSIVVGEGNQPPVAVISADPLNGSAPLEVNFIGRNSRDDFGIVSYLWDFGDGSTSNETDPAHTFLTNGTYTVVLTVEDIEGLTHNASVVISVNDSSDSVLAILLENPTQDGIARIRILNQRSGSVLNDIRLHDVGGRFIRNYSAQEMLNSSSNSYEIPVNTLRNGLYFIGLKFNNDDTILLKVLINN